MIRYLFVFSFFFFNDTATTEIYTLSLHDALPICWHGALVDAPRGVGVWPALALASRSVIWTYYGYPDAAKIAEEVVDPGRTLPRVLLGGIAIVTALYLLLNAAFLRSEEHTSELQSRLHL